MRWPFPMLRTVTKSCFGSLLGVLFCQQAWCADPTEVTWKFFEACSRGNFEEAWEMTAPVLQKRADVSLLKRASETLALNPTTLWSWNVLEQQRYFARVQGRGSHSDGKYSTVTITLIREGQQMVVYSICGSSIRAETKSDKGLAPFLLVGPFRSLSDVADRPLPTIPSVIETSQSILNGLIAIRRDSGFENDYARVTKSSPWERKRTDIEAAYRLYENNIDPGSSARTEWQASFAPDISTECLIRAETYCDIGVLRIQIVQDLAMTTEGWKPVRINLDVIPNTQEQERLVRKIIDDFNSAIRHGSFDQFYNSISNRWRHEVTVPQLDTAFRPFLEKQLELKLNDNSSIVLVDKFLEITPEISQISGYFDLPEHRVWYVQYCPALRRAVDFGK
jgi:hypothetical protein